MLLTSFLEVKKTKVTELVLTHTSSKLLDLTRTLLLLLPPREASHSAVLQETEASGILRPAWQTFSTKHQRAFQALQVTRFPLQRESPQGQRSQECAGPASHTIYSEMQTSAFHIIFMAHNISFLVYFGYLKIILCSQACVQRGSRLVWAPRP